MDPSPGPEPLDLSLLLPRDAYYQLVHSLRALLPPPVTGTPEDEARRDNAAIAQVACLLPASPAEATLGAQFVAAHAHAADCLRFARKFENDGAFFLKFTAQAASMMRQSQGAMRTLLRLQAARQKIETDATAAGRAAWTEHCAAEYMAQALPGGRPASMPPPPPPPPEPTPESAQDDEPVIDPIVAAEEYAQIYPERAALIRRAGGVPDNVSFGAPEAWLARALVTGRTPTLLALDRQQAGAHAA
jgi:hypothetical protein